MSGNVDAVGDNFRAKIAHQFLHVIILCDDLLRHALFFSSCGCNAFGWRIAGRANFDAQSHRLANTGQRHLQFLGCATLAERFALNPQ